MGSKMSGTALVWVWVRAMRARVEDRMTSATTRMECYTCKGEGQFTFSVHCHIDIEV